MKNWQHEASKVRKMLLEKKRNGVKEVIWCLDNQARKDEVDRLGFPIEPWLCEIRTRTFKQIRDKPSLIKELHYSYKSGKKRIVRRLNNKQLRQLKKHGIKPRVIKYKIYLV